MLKVKDWAETVKQIMEVLPIEEKSIGIKETMMKNFVDTINEVILKNEVYEQAGYMLGSESDVTDPLPPINFVAKKAEALLDPSINYINDRPLIIDIPVDQPELAETYDATDRGNKFNEDETLRAKRALESEGYVVREPIDPVFGLTPSTMKLMDERIDIGGHEVDPSKLPSYLQCAVVPDYVV